MTKRILALALVENSTKNDYIIFFQDSCEEKCKFIIAPEDGKMLGFNNNATATVDFSKHQIRLNTNIYNYFQKNKIWGKTPEEIITFFPEKTKVSITKITKTEKKNYIGYLNNDTIAVGDPINHSNIISSPIRKIYRLDENTFFIATENSFYTLKLI